MRFLPFIPALVLFCASAQAEEVSSSRARKYAQTMQALIRAENEEELTKLIARMGVLDHPRSVILIPPAATLLPSKINYEEALEAIGSLENPEAVAALIKNYKKARSLEDKVLLLDSFGGDDGPYRARLDCDGSEGSGEGSTELDPETLGTSPMGNAGPISAADLTGSGSLDLVATDAGRGLYWFENDGAGNVAKSRCRRR